MDRLVIWTLLSISRHSYSFCLTWHHVELNILRLLFDALEAIFFVKTLSLINYLAVIDRFLESSRIKHCLVEIVIFVLFFACHCALLCVTLIHSHPIPELGRSSCPLHRFHNMIIWSVLILSTFAWLFIIFHDVDRPKSRRPVLLLSKAKMISSFIQIRGFGLAYRYVIVDGLDSLVQLVVDGWVRFIWLIHFNFFKGVSKY